MTHPPGKHQTGGHVNTQSPAGPVHYYRARTGHRLLFREAEIRDVDPTPMGAVVTTVTGCEYKVTCPKPEAIVQ
jgi:hypothetical protein